MRRLLLTPAATAAVLAPPACAHEVLVDGSPGPGDDVAPGGTLVRLEI